VAATGFLPRVLSFLCALSHLERDAHRPNHLFIQPQTPLSPGESVSQLVTSHTQSRTAWPQQPTEIQTPSFLKTGSEMEKWSHGHGFGTEASRTSSISDRGCTRIPRHHTGFSVQNRGETGSFRINHRLLVQYGGIHGFSQSQTQAFRITGMHEGSLQNSGQSYCSEPVHAQAVRSNGRRNPSHSSTLAILFACTRVDTCRPGTACVPPARITFPWLGT
jgi:hypothetical protein